MSKRLKIILVLVLVFIIGSVVYNFYTNYRRIKELETKIEKLDKKIDRTQKENEKLKTRLQQVNDLEYIEKVAREKLGLVKPGEKLLIPVEEKRK